MAHSLEAYFLVNFAVDAALSGVIARANECFRLSRILFCGFLGACYAILIESVSARLANPLIQMVLLIILSIILCGDPSMARWRPIALQLFGGAMILGGIGSLHCVSGRTLPLLLGAGLILTGILFSQRSRLMRAWEVSVLVSLRGKSSSFTALIDTGNRLHEPLSGLPVLVAESGLLRDLLSSDRIAYRSVAFGALNGKGSLKCFRPDMVLIRRGDRFVRAPDVWIGVYPGTIPGVSRALAPPSFAVIPGKT